MKLFCFPSFPIGIIIGSLLGCATLSIGHHYEFLKLKELYEGQIRLVQKQKLPIYEIEVELNGTNPVIFTTNLSITVPLRFLSYPK